MRSGESPSIPNFIISSISFEFLLYFQGFQRLAGLLTVPLLYHLIRFKLLYGFRQGIICHMHIPVHCCLDAGMSQKLL